MSLLVNTKYRSEAPEIMDDFSLEGTELRDTFDKLELINRLLGGNRVTLNGIAQILKPYPKDKTFTIIDLGCGHGDILRDVAKWGVKNGYNFNLIGVDANADAIAYANELSEAFPNLSFSNIDIFSEDFQNIEFDIVLCTLFLHHFKPDELESLLKSNFKKAKIGMVVNDLQRSRMAYYLFNLISLFTTNKMVREDGLTSILKALKRKDLEELTLKLKAKASIKWKWAFRYQWILTKA